MSRSNEGTNFLGDRFGRFEPYPRSKSGDDAVGTKRIAAILNFNKRPLMAWKSINPLSKLVFFLDNRECVVMI